MKRLISAILSVMLMLNTTFAYTVKITAKGIDLQVTGEVGSEIEIGSKIPEALGWNVIKGNIEIVDDKFTMPSEDVEIEVILPEEKEKFLLTIMSKFFTQTQYKTENDTVSVRAINSNEVYTFTGWTATGITLTDEQKTNAELSFTMPGNDVTLEANYIAQEIIANEAVELGAYITYVPSKTESIVLGTDSGAIVDDMDNYGYTSVEYEVTNEEVSGETWNSKGESVTESEKRKLVNQKFVPNSTTSWRVLKNNNGQLDIISTESIRSLTLRGATGYTKAVYTLNKLCEDYINPTYADSARNPGYVEGSSLPIIDTTTWSLSHDYIHTQGHTGFPYEDELYSIDQTQIKDTAQVLHSSKFVWLASRSLYTDSYSAFRVRYLGYDGSLGVIRLYHTVSETTSDNPGSGAYSGGVRPIVSLKSGIKITGGEGTETSPYTISID